MPNPSTYPYRRFPTIQVGAADHAARGTDAVKQELHALCAGSSKTVVTVECYPGTDQAEILALFPHAELVIHADDLAILPAELDAKIEHELTDDPVFGIMTTWQMKDFYPEEALCAARNKIDAVTAGLVLIYGAGASLVERADITIYADITRWEIQLRFRKGQDNWHTAMHDLPQRAKYKRGYFAEWRWGDRIKDKLLPVFDYYLDTTSAGNPAIVPGTACLCSQLSYPICCWLPIRTAAASPASAGMKRRDVWNRKKRESPALYRYALWHIRCRIADILSISKVCGFPPKTANQILGGILSWHIPSRRSMLSTIPTRT